MHVSIVAKVLEGIVVKWKAASLGLISVLVGLALAPNGPAWLGS